MSVDFLKSCPTEEFFNSLLKRAAEATWASDDAIKETLAVNLNLGDFGACDPFEGYATKLYGAMSTTAIKGMAGRTYSYRNLCVSWWKLAKNFQEPDDFRRLWFLLSEPQQKQKNFDKAPAVVSAYYLLSVFYHDNDEVKPVNGEWLLASIENETYSRFSSRTDNYKRFYYAMATGDTNKAWEVLQAVKLPVQEKKDVEEEVIVKKDELFCKSLAKFTTHEELKAVFGRGETEHNCFYNSKCYNSWHDEVGKSYLTVLYDDGTGSIIEYLADCATVDRMLAQEQKKAAGGQGGKPAKKTKKAKK